MATEFVATEIPLEDDVWRKVVELSKIKGTRFECLIGEVLTDYMEQFSWDDIRKMREVVGCRCKDCGRENCNDCTVCDNCPNKGYAVCVRY